MSGVDVLGYSSFLVSIIGIFLNAKKKIACWPVWLVSNSGWIVYSILQKDIPQVILWIAFSVSNVYGWYQWKKDFEKEKFKPNVYTDKL